MIKAIVGGATAVALLLGPAAALARSPAPVWIVNPSEDGCRAELELSGRSGGTTPLTIVSDGELVSLKFTKEGLPARAFLPIRVDGARYANLMLRGDDGSGELILSQETEAAMRRGGELDIAWLADEPRSASLAGSDRGLADLKVCGAQTTARQSEQAAVQQAERERTEAQARAQALNEAQLAAVRAQAAAAEAQRQRAEAERRQAEAAAERDRQAAADAKARADEQARRQAYEEERRRAYESRYDDGYADRYGDEARWAPPPRAWPPARWRDPYEY